MSVVYISPSLQSWNTGVGDYGTEKDRMRLIANSVVQLLQYNHLEVYTSRQDMSLSEAVDDSNHRGTQLHVAIHSNAGNGQARGCEVFYKSESGRQAAQLVYDLLCAITPVSDRGVKHTDSLYELNKTKAVTILIETAFHDNPDDAYWIMNHVLDIAEAIAKGVCGYFGIEFKNPKEEVRRYLETMDVLQLQKTLNAWKVTDSDGNSLKEDGIMGKKTQSALAKAKELLNFILK